VATSELYIGLMSGTSIDGVDVALVDFSNSQCKLVHSALYPIPSELRHQLVNISCPDLLITQRTENRIELMARLDVSIAEVFAAAVNHLIDKYKLDKRTISAIGSHGQTIRHRPNQQPPFTLQIGDPNIIAERTGIKTVADFRRMDIAAGGQGAPLAPAFHNAVLRTRTENRVILNLGGIANITLLPKSPHIPVIGFDTGPANTLMDAWFKENHPGSDELFDRNSQFALKGTVHSKLLLRLLEDPYFQLPYPKSTGREYFSIDWLKKHISQLAETCSATDIQRTLLELTVQSVADAVLLCDLKTSTVLSCGGGMHNKILLKLIAAKLGLKVIQTDDVGVNGDYLEAMTFAWLAKRRIEALPGNLPSVTGAKTAKILGAVYQP